MISRYGRVCRGYYFIVVNTSASDKFAALYVFAAFLCRFSNLYKLDVHVRTASTSVNAKLLPDV